MARVTIKDLPFELLSWILDIVRKDSSLSNFKSVFLCCKLWNCVAEPLLWKDIIVSHKTIRCFVLHAKKTNLALTKSLTILLHRPGTIQYDLLTDAGLEHTLRVPYLRQWRTAQAEALWSSFEHLAKLLTQMTALSTYSLTVVDPPNATEKVFDDTVAEVDQRLFIEAFNPVPFTMSRSVISEFLYHMPLSIRNLELDTKGFNNDLPDTGPEIPLCELLRNILPRLKRLKLCMSFIGLQCLRGPCTGAHSDWAPIDGANSPLAPLLEEIILNTRLDDAALPSERWCTCCASSIPKESLITAAASMALLPERTWAFSSFEAGFPALKRALLFGAEYFMYRGRCPQKQCLWHVSVIRSDLLSHTSSCYPLHFCSGNYNGLRQMFIGLQVLTETGLVAPIKTIDSRLQDEAWLDTKSGSRLPSAVHSRDGWGVQYTTGNWESIFGKPRSESESRSYEKDRCPHMPQP